MSKDKDLDKLSFEDALGELEKIVRTLESGAGDLKTSIDAYERGMTLKNFCEAKLKEAQGRIEKITLAADGTAKAEAFSLSE
ncbi:MAG TPA: exodeoxyribonuclease VII small subunit [Alphaproteobacteria bacterium]|nr:exodeoxyribonuclease VII small subunit [Rhodospirillaceae bacterium]HRI76475.1 exodeoxyribonuclease VII small subunit [Alphaproteobacteria bacterium]HRJ66436.1 exodeoxyribonuclease VII small subunit [Alphaproteobacteria bacterium]